MWCEIYHGDRIGHARRVDAALCCFPTRATVVRRLRADHVFGILADHIGARLRVHLADILLARAGHTRADDIDESQHSHLRRLHNCLDKIRKVLPARAARVDTGRDPVGQIVVVGVQPGGETVIGVQMNID